MKLSIFRNPHFVLLYISAILFFVGAALLFSAFYTGWKGYMISTWPQTDARILSSEAKLKRTTQGYNYRVNVMYEYSVDGTVIKGTKIGLNDLHFSSLNHAQQVARVEFFQGKTLKTFYNPSNPQEAFLEGGIPFFSFVYIAIGSLLFLLGLFLIKHRNNLRNIREPTAT